MHAALATLLRADSDLLVFDVNERSITHRLAVYLERHFPGWNVDCEYNRDFEDPKRMDLQRRNIDSADTQATTVFPDIIVHKRGTDQNLVVIEMKKSSNPDGPGFDFQKLNEFKAQLGYQFAIFIEVRTGNCDPSVNRIEWV
ncbi:MAG: hypothetical protein C0622_04300 [Desulfuromonas sp.]|nr:MAG: hypothetical protein C0622_04300 [Desulfuromonas sp.]